MLDQPEDDLVEILTQKLNVLLKDYAFQKAENQELSKKNAALQAALIQQNQQVRQIQQQLDWLSVAVQADIKPHEREAMIEKINTFLACIDQCIDILNHHL